MRRVLGFLALAVVLAVASPALAQQRNGALFLTVTDDEGNVLSGVEVALAGADFTRSATSDDQGRVRFIELQPGKYELTLKNQGFNTSILQGVQIDSGAATTMDVSLQKSDIVEEVIVTAKTPLLDKRKTGTNTIFTKSEIEQVPTARDPWSIISTIPGVTTDRVNVAGSEAGQQANIVGKGDDGDQTVWMMDGVEFTDVAAIGGSSTYLDFNSFEQVGFTTAGGDFASQTPGVQLEFVTKQGSNRHTGTARFLYTEAGMQSDNAGGLTQPAWDTSGQNIAGNGVNEIFEKNFDIGGPLVKDNLWYWFGFSQNDIGVQLINGLDDETKLKNTSVKLHGQFIGKGSYKGFYTVGDKIKFGRTGYPPTQRPAETRWNQTGPTPIYGGTVSYFFTPNLEASVQYSHVSGGFQFDQTGDFSAQIFQDDASVFHNAFSVYKTRRPQDQYLAKGNWFFDTGNWDHELKFGFRYKTTTTESFSKYSEADLIATKWYTNSITGNPQIYLYRELNIGVDQDYTNVWVGDTVLHGPWTISAGFNYSDQSGTQLGTSAAPNGTTPDLYLGTSFSGFDPGFTWSNFAPRVGATYTFDWEKRLLLRASAGQYVDQLGTGVVAYNLPLGFTRVVYDWDDADGDDFFDWDPTTSTGEIVDLSGPGGVPDGIIDCNDATASSGIDPCNTGVSTTNFKIDPDLEAPVVTEFNIGAEWELMQDFNLGLTYTNRSKDDIVWAPYYNNTVFMSSGRVETLAGSAIYACGGGNTTSGTAPDGTFTWSEPYCQLTPAGAANLTSDQARWQTNFPGYKQKYDSIELTATKRLSERWMMRAFLAYTDWTHQFDGEALNPGIYGRGPGRTNGAGAAGDPTNFRGGLATDGGLIAVQSTASGGKGDIFVGTSTWQLNVNGLYQLPKDWSVSGNFYTRQGYGLPYYDAVSTSIEGTKNVQINDVDSERYDDLYLLDLRVAKLLTLGQNTNVEVAAEVFNATNENTVLQLSQRADSSSYQRINEILSPRVLRLVATINF
jgi:hypothetical protein